MPMPGWVKVGLWLRDKEDPEILYQVVKIDGDFVECKEKRDYTFCKPNPIIGRSGSHQTLS